MCKQYNNKHINHKSEIAYEVNNNTLQMALHCEI